jgi:hypothetical protein
MSGLSQHLHLSNPLSVAGLVAFVVLVVVLVAKEVRRTRRVTDPNYSPPRMSWLDVVAAAAFVEVVIAVAWRFHAIGH